ncbi:DUF3617 domain-containing protein [Methylocystis echinoides]|uniref:DUF3617 family protein n=1 Tax=Methylocystis echinoides TaxID=29468 RepID=A0A9W6GZ29_9HYPH|nr:DUF3617 family protein [Methylocystis echinoides]GLI95609.1 hypothetical protein LMG27198_46010 [Methylocystis echinoides]
MKSALVLVFCSVALAMPMHSPSHATEIPSPNKGDLTAELPQRAPGSWRITTISPETGTQTNEVCIEKGDNILGAQSGDCSRPKVARAADQTIVTIECGAGDNREINSMLFTGDFQTWYRAQVKITRVGPDSQERHAGLTIDARFLAPGCN